MPEGIQQYSAEVKGAKSLWGPAAAPAVVTVECTPIVDDVLPASTGVVMTAEPGEYELAATKNIAKGNYNGNQLKAIEKKTVISAYWGVYDMQKGVFVPVDPSFSIVDDCKAILKIEGDNLPDEIEVVLKEIPTGINAIDNGKLTMDNGYDLSGRKLSNGKLSNSQLPKGIYIVNGKKVVLK